MVKSEYGLAIIVKHNIIKGRILKNSQFGHWLILKSNPLITGEEEDEEEKHICRTLTAGSFDTLDLLVRNPVIIRVTLFASWTMQFIACKHNF